MNPSEITKLLKEQIKNFGNKAEVSEVGKSIDCRRWNSTSIWSR